MPVLYPRRSRYVEEYKPPWYTRPRFYLPLGAAIVLLIAGAIYGFLLAADLSRKAESYNLAELDKMESASVILDRNEKIVGQIYVENRETVPYDQLPRDLINAVVAMEDTKFYQHSGYDFFGIDLTLPQESD